MIDNGMVYFAREGGVRSADGDEQLGDKICLNPAMANRHGFVCGATGTGKTVTLKVVAESFSALGCPVFVSDVKGDVAGLSQPGTDNEKMQARLTRFDIRENFRYRGYPVEIYDVFGENGIPLRTTISEMGPQLLARVLDLNDTQTSLLAVVFKIADDNGLLLYDTKDMKAMLQFAAEHAGDYELEYGHISKSSVSTIVRSIVALEAEGADRFFGEPAINITDFFRINAEGQGIINILDAESLIGSPRLYSAFMLYLLSELFEVLPEVGDLDKPKMVFFFDEAHLLFDNASKILLDKIEQVVKLIRSKGVAIFFVTQNPADIPGEVMAQLGNKIEHALRAYTPAEQKAIKAAADAFRENPNFNTEELLQNLGTGEAIVSVLDEKGIPTVAQHAFILPPESLMSSISGEDRLKLVQGSVLYTKYASTFDPESAYELLERRKMQEADEVSAEQERQKAEKERQEAEKEEAKRTTKHEREVRKATQSVMRSTSGTIGREVGKAVGEALFGKKGRTLGGNIGANLGRSLMGTLNKR